jgi:UDPglucose--hexose-1-phosphate uridylyltransferase
MERHTPAAIVPAMTDGNAPAPRLLVDPTTARPILMSPVRQLRPMHTGGRAARESCPFCPGHEHETPPELDRTGSSTVWTARAFPNKYPAAASHEVVAEGGAHCEQPADLPAAIWRDVLVLWQRRIAALEALPGVACAFLFKNVGAPAGASIAHNHSQLLGLAAPPPRLLLEVEQAQRLGACPWCRSIAGATREGREVFASAAHVVLAPDPPKLPNETWLLPRACDDDFLRTDLDSLAAALAALFRAVAGGLARPAFNFWLHRLPGAPLHWHFELQPRTGQMAGLELGGDMYINSVPSAESAARLRRALQ